jgi:HSP20 family protein
VIFTATVPCFFHTFTLPTTVEPDKIVADFNNGVLSVHLPKKASAKPQTIKVEVNKQLATVA